MRTMRPPVAPVRPSPARPSPAQRCSATILRAPSEPEPAMPTRPRREPSLWHDAGRLASLLLWGPPGSGKTTLARVLAAEAGHEFTPLSAVDAGVADVRAALADA